MVGIGIEIGAPGEPSHPEGERDWRGLCAMALETYTRHPAGKHRILDVMAAKGIPLPLISAGGTSLVLTLLSLGLVLNVSQHAD